MRRGRVRRALALAALAAAVAVPQLLAQAAAPRVFSVRPELLLAARSGLDRGDPELRPALDALLEKADDALRMKPVSVTEKRRLPPSGDRHDYMSMGPYWWPDPSKPDGLPYIRRDGERNPESYDDFDSPRWNAMAEAVHTLGLAYWFTGEEKYARKATELLRVFFLNPATRMNPNLNFGQSIPGRTEGRGIGIIDTREIPELVDALGLLEPSRSFTARDEAGMKLWLREYLDWLLTSPLGIDEQNYHNNHGTWYDAQILAIALYVDNRELAKEIVHQARIRRIDEHITPAGHQPHELQRTKSFGYSTMNLEGMSRIAEMARHVGVDLWSHRPPEGGGIRAALDFIAPYADPAKAQAWEYEQIEPIQPDPLVMHLRRASHVYEDPRYEQYLERVPESVRRSHPAVLLYPD